MKGGHGRSGPPQLTAEERRLRGSRTRRHHRDRAESLAPNVAPFPAPSVTDASVDGALQVPTHLEKSGRAEWQRLVNLLRSEGRLLSSDAPVLMVAAAAFDL